MPDIVRTPGRPSTRAFTTTFEVRGTEGRTVVGVAVPFSQPTTIRDWDGEYDEDFAFGAFERTLKERGVDKVKVLGLHDRQVMPLGRALDLKERTDGLHAELGISKTAAGDEALELVRDGALDSLSIGFTPVAQRIEGRNVTRTEVKLHEISLVPFPAYDGAKISGVRSEALFAALRGEMPLPADVREALTKLLDETPSEPEAVTPEDDEAARAYLHALQLRHRNDLDVLGLTA